MPLVIRLYAVEPGERLRFRTEGQQPFTRGECGSQTGVLRKYGTAGGEIARAAIAEPSRPHRHVPGFCYPEFRQRAANEASIAVGRSGGATRIDERPSVGNKGGE